MISISSSDRKSVNSKLVSSPCIATTTDPAVIMATDRRTMGAFPLWNSAALSARLPSSSPLLLEAPMVLSTKTCIAPTVTVLARNADTTPRARVAPNVLRGGKGEREFARNAKTVVVTANDSATLSSIRALAHASAELLESPLALS